MNPFTYLAPRPRLYAYLHGACVGPQQNGKYVLTRDAFLGAHNDCDDDFCMVLAAGFRFDYASVPKWARWAIPKKHNDYDRATIVHDWLYSHHAECDEMAGKLGYTDPRLFADQVMLVMSNRKSWRVPVMYWALRWFCKPLWNKYSD